MKSPFLVRSHDKTEDNLALSARPITSEQFSLSPRERAGVRGNEACEGRKGCDPARMRVRSGLLAALLVALGATPCLADAFRVASVEPAGEANDPFARLEVFFNQPVQETSFTLDDIVLTGAGQPIVPAALNKVDGAHYWIDLTGLTSLNDYTLVIGPDILNESGQPMDQNRDGTPGDAYRVSLIATGKVLDPTNLHYDGQNVIFVGNTSTLDGDHSFLNLGIFAGTVALTGGSTLTVVETLDLMTNAVLLVQGKNTTAQVNGQWAGVGGTINVSNLVVETGAKITADGQGYAAKAGPGAGTTWGGGWGYAGSSNGGGYG
ncbi:MAG: hypothetical protein HY735_02250, partial [Verrucomicrobia bacterium]|nr:hypothetical protein [Verrucomicrobiota bacterium]